MSDITPESLRATAIFADAAAEVLGDESYFRRSKDVTAAANALRAAADEIDQLKARIDAPEGRKAANEDRFMVLESGATIRFGQPE